MGARGWEGARRGAGGPRHIGGGERRTVTHMGGRRRGLDARVGFGAGWMRDSPVTELRQKGRRR
eukprot:47120-Prymnesium_polylepis.1